MIYIKNKITQEITEQSGEYLQLSKNIRDQSTEITQDEVDLYLLQEAKKVKTAEIEKLKSIELYKHIDYLGTKFVSSEKANSNILGAIILNHRSYDWVDVYGRPKKVNIEELKGLATLIAQQRGIAYNKVATKLRALHFAKSIKEVNDINW
tara:strand:- start:1146 stop:1598 length:453 start_codon:yes stop_codon:yes gene_type:complete